MVVTAVITGVFMVLAGVLTYYMTTKSAKLTYSLARGPALPSQEGYKSIYVVSVSNAVKVDLDSVTCHIYVPGGKIEDARPRIDAAIPVTESKSPSDYNIALGSLNQGESFSVSLMLDTITENEEPRISVRGKGVVAQKANELASAHGATRRELFIMGLAAILAVSVSVMLGSRLSFYLPTIATTFTPSVGPFDRNETVAYILSSVGLHNEAKEVRFAPSEVSNKGTADYLFSVAKSDENKREQCAAALKAMLLIKNIAAQSRAVVLRNLKLLEGPAHDERSANEICGRAKDSERNAREFRDSVDKLVGEIYTPRN